MKRLLLLLLICPSAAVAQSVTPNFTTGTMTQTVTATQTVNETSVIERFGGDHHVWNGDNVEPIEEWISCKRFIEEELDEEHTDNRTKVCLTTCSI